MGDYVQHLILPAIALAVGWVGYLARLVRASVLEILNETYIRAAMASGIRKNLVQYKYALKGALIPTVAVLGVGHRQPDGRRGVRRDHFQPPRHGIADL